MKPFNFLFLGFFLVSINLLGMDGPALPASQNIVWQLEKFLCQDGKRICAIKITSNLIINNNTFENINRYIGKMQADPFDVLQSNQALAQKLRQGLSTFAQLDADNPIFLLDECSNPDCKLSRQANRALCPRNAFRKILGNSLKLMHLESSENITKIKALSFRSGMGFTELEALINFQALGYQVKNMILIDAEYKSLINILGGLEHTSFNFEDTLKMDVIPDLDGETLEKAQRFFQFLRAAQTLHPGMNLTLIRNDEDYILAQDKNSDLIVDIIFALDHMVEGETRETLDEKLFNILGHRTKNQGEVNKVIGQVFEFSSLKNENIFRLRFKQKIYRGNGCSRRDYFQDIGL